MGGQSDFFADLTIVRADLSAKNPVRVATVAALPAYTRTGNVIVANANGALPQVDFTSLVVGQEFLLRHGASQTDNGPYVVDSLGSGGSKFQATRRPDCSASAHFFDGMTIPVSEGLFCAGFTFKLTTSAPVVLGTTALVFEMDVQQGMHRHVLVDEFCGGSNATGDVGELGWGVGGTGTPTNIAMTPAAGRLGGRRFGTSATTNHSHTLFLAPTITTGGIIASDLEYFSFLFQLQSIVTQSFRIGFGNNALSSATAAIYFKYDSTVSAKPQTVSVIGAGTETATQSGVADVAAGVPYFVECWRNLSTGALSFAWNRTPLTGHSLYLPTNEVFAPQAHMITLANVATTYEVDRWERRSVYMATRY